MGQALTFRRSADFHKIVQWMTDPLVYRPITEVLSQAPFRFQAPAHGMPDDWLAYVPGLIAGCDAGQVPDLGRPSLYTRIAVTSADSFELPDVSAETARFFVKPTMVIYKTPQDLAGFSGELVVRASEDPASHVLFTIDAAHGLSLDNVLKQIDLLVEQAVIALFTWDFGFYRLTMTGPSADTYTILDGTVKVTA